MAETQRMTGLVQRYAEQIDAASDLPRLGVVQVHICRDWFRINRKWIEGVRQDGGSDKRIPVSVRSRGKQDTDSLICVRGARGRESDLDNAGPLSQGTRNLGFHGSRRQLCRHVKERVV
jgi:hypothetical protein